MTAEALRAENELLTNQNTDLAGKLGAKQGEIDRLRAQLEQALSLVQAVREFRKAERARANAEKHLLAALGEYEG